MREKAKEILVMLVVGIAASLIAIGIATVVSGEWVPWAIANVIFFCLALIAVHYLIDWLRRKNADATQLDLEFYENRDEQPRLENQVQEIESLYGYWRTGRAIVERNMLHGKLKRIILPDPRAASFEAMAKATRSNPWDLRDDVVRTTRKAWDSEKRIEVHWFEGLTACTLMIGNPDSSNSWVLVETLIPLSLKTQDHPSFKIWQASRPSLVECLKKGYDEIWDESDPPTKEDIKEAEKLFPSRGGS